ncbi:hypothetical protein M885DRAFT_511127 [Pelagophyceae sp. CCMP2097]|nr:hypothetical protein M885DRAFT_511127 [Pelagophyceae sp. CCMP2097]
MAPKANPRADDAVKMVRDAHRLGAVAFQTTHGLGSPFQGHGEAVAATHRGPLAVTSKGRRAQQAQHTKGPRPMSWRPLQAW